MTEAAGSDGALRLLAALQYGDGQFPGGGFAFSWGLEAMVAEGRLQRDGFAAYLEGQLRHRWAPFDRVFVAHAHAAADDPVALGRLDALVEAMSTVEAARVGSRRAGLALLGTHRRLDTPGAAALRARIDAGDAHGHLPIVQGVVLAGAGLDCTAALAVSAHAGATAMTTAAIRLGLIGHLDAQRALRCIRPWLGGLLAQERPTLDAVCSVVPEADLAMMRHADLPQRLFSN